MTDSIINPYVFGKDELKLIKSSFTKYTDWDKQCFDEVKKSIKDDLRPKQNNLCCYCKWELGHDIKQVDIEHIIPKSKYDKFTFTPKNLALSCPACNTHKGSQAVLKKEIKNYPRTGTNVSIIHPHFDKYSEHIEVHDNAIYEPLSSKGCETIKLCNLYRLKEVLRKTKESKSQKTQISKLVAELKEASEEEQQSFIDLLSQLTNKFQGT